MTASFDHFQIQLDETFGEISASLVENKQLTHKVIKSYKVTNPEGFDENIIITQTQIKQKIETQEFASINLEKIQVQIPGYSLIGQEQRDFTCNKEKIDGIYANFTITDQLFDDKPKTIYYVGQYYFLDEDQ